MAKKKKKRRGSCKATPDRRKFVPFLLDILKDVTAAVLAELIIDLIGL